MSELLTSTQFWLGGTLLLCFQIGKYSELNAEDEDLRRWIGVLPGLRARDFLPFRSYLGNLIAFLLVTFVGYTLACIASPSLIAGWLHVTNSAVDAQSLEKHIQSVPYPLFIAAMFMGLAHQAIPGFSKIANLQRDIFHELVGIPGVVAHTATDYSVQLWSKLGSDAARIDFLSSLTSSGWRNRLRPYADVGFFDAELSRRTITVSSASAMSQSELKALLEQIIYILSIAAVRRGGGAALRRLAEDLDVMPSRSPDFPIRKLVAFILISAVVLTLLWFVIPLLAPLVDILNGTQPLEFWPHGVDALARTGMYLFAQIVPVLLGGAILVISVTPGLDAEQDDLSLRDVIEKHALTLLFIGAVVFVFDYAQLISDYGRSMSEITTTPWTFFKTWAPYNLLHATISVAICMVLLSYMVRGGPRTPGVSTGYFLAILLCAVVFSVLYAVARLRFDYKTSIAIDYVLIISLLNSVAAAIALYLSQSICHHRLMKARQRAETPLPPQSPALPVGS